MANPYAPPRVGFREGIANVGDSFVAARDASEKRRKQKTLEQLFAGGIPMKDGVPDYGSMVQMAAEAGQPDVALKLAELSSKQSGGGDEYGLVPTYVTDANGNLQLMQMRKSGGAKQLDLPEGYKPTEPMRFLDTGTGYSPMGTRTGGPPAGLPGGGMVPKDVAGAAAATEAGQATGKAQVNLPVVANSTRRLIEQIETIEKSPNLSNLTGPIQGRLPTLGGQNMDTEAMIEQATGGGFLQMYDTLRGAGAITEQEGSKAGAALTRLANMKQSDGGYRIALGDAKREVFNLYNVARIKAGQPALPNPYERGNTTSIMRAPATPPPPVPQPQARAAPPPSVAATVAEGGVNFSPNGQSRPMPSPDIVQKLRQYANNPEARAAFDELYGPGAADHFLSGGR